MIIYKITNKINGKVYIGQTIVSLNQRWSKHKSDSKKGSILAIHCAIRKYGINNFIIEEIDGANSLTELNYKEWLLINNYNSMYPFGYNIKPGGNNREFLKETKEKIGKKTKERMTVEMRDRISKSLKGRKFDVNRRKMHAEMVYSILSKSIKLENVNTGEVILLKSRKDASYYGISPRVVSDILSGATRYRPIKGYWIYEGFESCKRPETTKRKPGKSKNKQPTTPDQMMIRNQ